MTRIRGPRTKDKAGKESTRLIFKALKAELRRLYFIKMVMGSH